MASLRIHPLPVAVFGIGLLAAQVLPSVAAHVFGVGRPVSAPELGFALEVSVFTAIAATGGFALAGCNSVLRAICAIPIAVLLMFLIPSRLGIWLSESFRSVFVNVTVLGVLFIAIGAAAGWVVSRFFNGAARHA